MNRNRMISRKSIWWLISFGLNLNLQAQPNNPNTNWFKEAKYGLFVHFLLTKADFPRQVDAFDANAFAQECADAGAGYVMFTLGQNSGYYCAPNSTYDAYTGYQSGQRCATRDLPMDLANALARKGIPLMLYVTGDLPLDDTLAARKLGGVDLIRNGNGENWVYNDTLVNRWGSVMREWSDRYGAKVAGWWVDGCYTKSQFKDAYAQTYIKALKHGNPKAIVAFNSGLNYDKVSDNQDYLAGEERTLLTGDCQGRWRWGAQWHELSFLGSYWGAGAPQYSAQQLVDHLNTKVNANGGVLTVDVLLDQPYVGSHIQGDHLTVLKAVKSAVRDKH